MRLTDERLKYLTSPIVAGPEVNNMADELLELRAKVKELKSKISQETS